MSLIFFIIAAVTVVSAAAAMMLRNLIHCALCVAVAFLGLAAFYLQLEAQFAGFAQVFVYLGAVAILVLFAILLTRSARFPLETTVGPAWWTGLAVAALVFGSLAAAIFMSPAAKQMLPEKPVITVEMIGHALMTEYVLAMQVIALVLTVALVGGVIIAKQENE
jgi:NADH:ubiquinone oxidoreductase subunit 6 (subunit J)